MRGKEMDEREWLSSTDPQEMLRFITGDRELTYAPLSQMMVKEKRISDRKLRLFAVACCRQVWHHLTDDSPCPECKGVGVSNPSGLHGGTDTCRTCNHTGRINRSRRAVEVAERYADGEATEGESLQVQEAAYRVWTVSENPHPGYLAWAAGSVSIEHQFSQSYFAHLKAFGVDGAALIRDIVGNPFRPVTLPFGPPVDCELCEGRGEVPHYSGMFRIGSDRCESCNGKGKEPGPCPWLTPTVLSLARAAYEDRRPASKKIECKRCEGYSVGKLLKCPDCDNRGYTLIDDGSLDPVRLAILADALEEAGMGDFPCTKCEGDGGYSVDTGGTEPWGEPVDAWYVCDECGGTGRTPNPILAHLRSPGPHYRGCHVLDTLLAKS